MPDYYICLVSTMRAMAGPFPSPYLAASLINVQESYDQYCTASRYELAKINRYPKNKNGDLRLAFDVQSSIMGYKDLIIRCANCGNKLKYTMYRGWIHEGYDEHGALEAPMTPNLEICNHPHPHK